MSNQTDYPGDPYDECAKCGSWRYTHSYSDLAKSFCFRFVESAKGSLHRTYLDFLQKELTAIDTGRRYSVEGWLTLVEEILKENFS